jgi:hypothetical protein
MRSVWCAECGEYVNHDPWDMHPAVLDDAVAAAQLEQLFGAVRRGLAVIGHAIGLTPDNPALPDDSRRMPAVGQGGQARREGARHSAMKLVPRRFHK